MPDYYREIANPVDFKSISASPKKAGGYASVWDFLISVELMFSNAQVYNEKDSQIFARPASTLRLQVPRWSSTTGAPRPRAHVRVREGRRSRGAGLEPEEEADGGDVRQEERRGRGAPGVDERRGAVRELHQLRRAQPQAAVPRRADARQRQRGPRGRADRRSRQKRPACGSRSSWLPEDTFYKGKIVGFDPKMCAHEIQYDNGDVETMELWRKQEQRSAPPARAAGVESAKAGVVQVARCLRAATWS